MSILTDTLNLVKKESPIILGVIGAIGVAVTAVTVAKETPKAIDKWDDLHRHRNNVTKIEEAKILIPSYKKSIIFGSVTIACIAGSTILSNKQRFAITSAYMMLDQAYKQYKDKVNDIFGEGSAREVDRELTREKLEKLPKKSSDETMIIYEKHRDEFFERSLPEIQDAMYQLNRKFAKDGEVSLNDLYKLLSLDETKQGDSLGWSSYLLTEKWDGQNGLVWIDYELDLVKSDDGLECYELVLKTEPTPDYYVPF